MVSFTVFVRDCVVLVHDLKTMGLFTVFVGDHVVLVHDLKTMVLFTVLVRDCVILVNTVNKAMVLNHELGQHDLQKHRE
jgi:hypothetical protein